MSTLGAITRRRASFVLFTALPAAWTRSALGAVDVPARSIAIANFVDRPASEEDRVRELPNLIASDLRRSGSFIVVDSSRYPQSKIDVDTVPQFDAWRALPVDYLVTGALVSSSNGQVLIQFRLWSVATGQQRYGSQLFGGASEWSHVPHIIADGIMEAVTGLSGGFDKG